MDKSNEIIDIYSKKVMNTYFRTPLVLEKGKGSYITDVNGKRYLDFFPGWAVSGIGHCHPMVVKAIQTQAKKLLHIANNYYSEPQARLAELIIQNSFPGKVFFGNSGAEANEAAIKLARKYGSATGGRYEVIATTKSFHGRTIAMITATGQDKVKIGFEPLPAGFVHVPYNDLDAMKQAVTDKTVAIMIEPIQCEGGINIPSMEYIQGLRKLCDDKDLVLIFDEVQTGMGRTGKYFAFKNFNIVPDVMTLAKALGGGMPIGVCVAREKFQDILTPGSHASTFGGSPIVCAAGCAVFEAIEKEHLLENTVAMGAYIVKRLEELKKKHNVIKGIRSMGLVIGVELTIKGTDVYKKCMEKGLLINCTQETILRMMPPMTVNAKEVDKAIAILDKVLAAA